MEINGLVIEKMVLGMVGTNCYVVRRDQGDRCVVIDPGDAGKQVADFIRSEGLSLDDILLTHGHYDHILGIPELCGELGGRVCVCEEEREFLMDPGLNLSASVGRPLGIEADVVLHDGEIYETAGLRFRVIHTPGHTRGSCCFYLEDEGVLFSGDTLFFESIGRTDFPTGNGREILRSLNERLLTLPEHVRAFTGHGPATDIGYEKKNNPYVM